MRPCLPKYKKMGVTESRILFIDTLDRYVHYLYSTVVACTGSSRKAHYGGVAQLVEHTAHIR